MADQYYIESGYFDPELGYYVYTADAESAQSVTASLTAAVGVIKQASSTQSSAFDIIATISNIKGVDIVLTPFGSLTADVNVVRSAASTQLSTASQTASADRLRGFAIALSDAFSFTVTPTGGNMQNASASLSSAVSVTASIDALRGFSSSVSSAFTQTAQGNLVADITSTQAVTATLTAQPYKVLEFAVALNGAFSATMSVNAVVNPFATLEASAIMITDFVVNRSAAITLNNIVSLSSQGIRSAGLSSTQTSAFTQSTSANRSANLSSTQSSAFTLTASATRTKEFSSSVASALALSASARRLNRTPKTVDNFNNGGFITNTNSKFGGYSFTEGDIRLASGTHGIELSGKNWVIDFWYDPGSRNDDLNLLRILNTSAQQALNLDWNSSGRTLTLTVNLISGAVTTLTGTSASTSLSETGGWYHIRIEGQLVSGNYYYSLWINGTRQIQLLNNYSVNMRSSLGQWTFGSNTTTDGFVDELLVKNDTYFTGYNVTTFTAPTSAWTNDSTTDLLVHFDNNLDDDASTTDRFGAASLSSAVTLTVNAGKSVRGTSTISSVATVSATAVRTRTASAALAAQGFVVTVAGYRIDDLADLSSAFSLSTSVNRTASAVSTQNASASLSAVGGYRKSASIDVLVQGSLSATINQVLNAQASVSTAVTVTASAQRLRGASATLAAEGFVLAVAGTEQSAQASLSTASTLSATAVRTRKVSSALTTTATMTVDVGEIVQAEANLASAFSQSALGQRIRFGASTQTSAFAVTVDAVKTTSASSTQTSASALSTVIARIRDVNTALDTFVTATVLGNYIASNISSQTAQASTATQLNYIANAVMTAESTGFAIVVIAKTGEGAVEMSAQASMSVSAVKTAKFASALNFLATASATATRIKQFDTRTVTGAETTPNYWLQYVDNTLESETRELATDTVISFWARRPSRLETEGTYLFNRSRSNAGTNNPPPGTPPNYNDDYFTLGYDTDDHFKFTAYNEGSVDSGNGGFNTLLEFTWSDVVPTDTEWHHYLVHITQWSGAFPGNFGMRLWIDGDYKSVRTATGPSTYNHKSFWYSPLDIGYGSNINIAQIWAGQYDLDNSVGEVPTAFYNNGWVDMPTNGAISGSTVYVYALLNDPFSDKLQGVYDPVRTDPADEQTISIDSRFVSGYRAQGYSSQAQLAVSAQIVQVQSANITARATLAVTAKKTVNAVSTQSSAFALTSGTNVRRPASATLASAFAQSAQITTTRPAQTNLSVTVTLSADGLIVSGAIAQLNSQADLTINAGLLAVATASISTAATLTVSANRLKDINLAVNSACTVSASAVKTAQASSTQAITAALNTTAQVIPAIRIDLQAAFGLSAQTRKITGIVSAQTARFTVTAQIKKLAGFSANFTAFYTQLTVGEVIHLDPQLTWVIPAESRLYHIHTESRLWQIEPETRLQKIHRETRVYTVEAQTSLYKIKGY